MDARKGTHDAPQIPLAMQGLRIGHIVHGVAQVHPSYLDKQPASPVCLACIVTDIFDRATGYVQVRCQSDMQLYVLTYSEKRMPNTWHWMDHL